MSPSHSSEITGPFEIMRWDHTEAPSLERLERIMGREGFSGGQQQFEANVKTPEMKVAQEVFLSPIAGVIQVSFPGYGVIELNPGDILEIEPNITHDITAMGREPAQVLRGLN